MVSRPQLDLLPTEDVVSLLLAAEQRVVPAVRGAAPAIAAAADLAAERWRAGGRLLFAGAGTSGRLAAAQAAELPGTFGLPAGRFGASLAGSTDADEDDLTAAERDVADVQFAPADTLVAVAASGRTPYTVAIAGAARAAGCAVIAVVNAAATPLAALAAVTVEIDVGDEVLRGSTRLTAGTSQKVALDAITTAMMTRLGRVHGDLMVDVVCANAKLRDRAAGIVAEIAGTDVATAAAAVRDCGGDARAAAVRLVLGLSPAAAHDRAAAHESLRDALDTH